MIRFSLLFFKFYWLLAGLCCSFTLTGQNVGMSIWHENGVQTPQYKLYNGGTNTFGSEATAPTVVNNKGSVMMTAQSPTDPNEAFLLEITDGKEIYLHQWNGSSWTAGAFNPLGGADLVKNKAFRTAAITYSANGNALLVWDNDVADNLIHYRTWNGTAWAAQQTFTFVGNNKPVDQMILAAHPTSSEMVLTFTDDGDGDDYVYVWNGSSWGNGMELTIDGSLTSYDVNVIYEKISGHALLVYAKADDGLIYYRTWNGTAWSTESSKAFPTGATTNKRVGTTAMAASPNSDYILLALTTEGSEGLFMTWNGSIFSTATQDNKVVMGLDKPKNISPLDVAFESQSAQGLGIVHTSVTMASYFTWTVAGGYAAAASTPAFGDNPRLLDLVSDRNSDKIMLATNANKIGQTLLWNGSVWDSPVTHETDLGLNGDEGAGNGVPISFLWFSICNAGTTAPSLTTTSKSNNCPLSTVDLTTITANNLPSGTSLTWHTATPATTANKMTAMQAQTVAAGAYYAAFFDATNNCYSGISSNGVATTTVTATVNSCNVALTLAMTGNRTTVSPTQNIIYTLTLTNTGATTATNVKVKDQLPAGVTFVSATPSVGTYNSATGIWLVPSIATGAQTLSITVTAQ